VGKRAGGGVEGWRRTERGRRKRGKERGRRKAEQNLFPEKCCQRK
jgi:hypothetical protein